MTDHLRKDRDNTVLVAALASLTLFLGLSLVGIGSADSPDRTSPVVATNAGHEVRQKLGHEAVSKAVARRTGSDERSN